MQQLLNDLAVAALAAGASSTVAHELTAPDGTGLTPDSVVPDRSSPILVTAVDDTNVTFNNPSTTAQTANFRAWHYHSVIDYPPLAPQLWQGEGNPGGGITAPRAISGLLYNPAGGQSFTVLPGYAQSMTTPGTAINIVLGNGVVNTAVTGVGGLDAGAIANLTWYAIYAILNPTTGVAGCMISTSFTNAPTLPLGFTELRYIGPAFYGVGIWYSQRTWREGHTLQHRFRSPAADLRVVNDVGAAQPVASAIRQLQSLSLAGNPYLVAPGGVGTSNFPLTAVLNVEKLGDAMFLADDGFTGDGPVSAAGGTTTGNNFVTEVTIPALRQVRYRATANGGGTSTQMWVLGASYDCSGAL